MSNDFWARKLGQQPHGIVVPPQQPVQQQQVVVPPGYQLVPIQQHQAPVQQQPQQMTPQQRAIWEAEQRAAAQVFDKNRKITNMAELRQGMVHWEGGEAWKKEGNLRCPSCDSIHYTAYSGRGGINTAQGVVRPRSHCFSCGYNPDFVQADAANWSAAS